MSGRDEPPATAADARAARKVMGRAIRRLGVLEALLVAAAAVAAIVGGWLVALLGQGAFGATFGATWVVASLALFVVPGAAALVAERRSRRSAKRRESDKT